MPNHVPQVAEVFIYARAVTRNIGETKAVPGQFRGCLLNVLIPRATLRLGPASELTEKQSTNPANDGGDLCS